MFNVDVSIKIYLRALPGFKPPISIPSPLRAGEIKRDLALGVHHEIGRKRFPALEMNLSSTSVLRAANSFLRLRRLDRLLQNFPVDLEAGRVWHPPATFRKDNPPPCQKSFRRTWDICRAIPLPVKSIFGSSSFGPLAAPALPFASRGGNSNAVPPSFDDQECLERTVVFLGDEFRQQIRFALGEQFLHLLR